MWLYAFVFQFHAPESSPLQAIVQWTAPQYVFSSQACQLALSLFFNIGRQTEMTAEDTHNRAE
jgi:hypothetical protein